MSLPNSMGSDDHRIRDVVPVPASGLTDVRTALARSQIETPLRGVYATADPLLLTDTDPDWAR